jgi:hypothetical protein
MDLIPDNKFGELLLDLIEAQYGGDIDAGIQALMETTGRTEEEIVDIIQGHFIVEDEDLLANIIEAFPHADDEDLEIIVDTATEVEDADRQELIAAIESDQLENQFPEAGSAEEEEVQEPEEGELAASYSYNTYGTANFMQANFAQELNAIKQEIAEFKAYNALSGALKDLDHTARELQVAGVLPPSMKTLLIGNFKDDDSRTARFIEMSHEQQVPVETLLFSTQRQLAMMVEAAPHLEFQDYAPSEEDVAVARFSASLDSIVEEDLIAIFGE